MTARVRIGSVEFEVAGARLGAALADPHVARWSELAGWTARWGWDDGGPPGPDPEPQGTVALSGHDATRRNVLRFGTPAGVDFAFAWHARVGLQAEPPFDRELPLVASGRVRFTGIMVDTSAAEADAAVRARLARRIALDGLRAAPRELMDHRHADGVRTARLHFLPDGAARSTD
jgi:hypothetical protein